MGSSLIRTLSSVPRVSVLERFHCICGCSYLIVYLFDNIDVCGVTELHSVCSVASNSCHSGARYVHVHYTLCIHVHMTVHVYTYAVVYITVYVVVYLPHPGGIE